MSGNVVAHLEVVPEQPLAVEVKKELERRMGISHHRLRLLKDGHELSDGSFQELGSPDELHLVVLPYRHDKATELRSASAIGDLAQVDQLLQLPQDPNALSCEAPGLSVPFSPLQCAAECGHLEVVQRLLQARAAPDTELLGPLWFAAAHGHVEVVECLMDAGASKDKAEQSGSTAIQVAAANGQLDVVECLLKAGVNVNKPDRFGISPLRIAAARGHAEVVEQLVRSRAHVEQVDLEGRTPLWMAAQNNEWKVLQYLLAAQADPEHRDTSGDTPLRTAVAYGQVRTVQQLLEQRADVNRPGRHSMSPLLAAVRGGHTELLRCLLTARAAVKDVSGGGEVSCLLEAASRGDLEMVQALLEARADTNQSDASGKRASPLEAASARGYIDVVKCLLTASADQHQSHGTSPLIAAASCGQSDVVLCLLEAKADQQVETGGQTALHVAASGGHLQVLRHLLDAGADSRSLDLDGRSALALAQEAGHQDVVELLEQAAGARDDEGSHPAVRAWSTCSDQHLAIGHRNGDTSSTDEENALGSLAGFADVFFVPGNHDLWTGDDMDSLGKLLEIFTLCKRLGIHTVAKRIGTPEQGCWVCPILSWHHQSWDPEPDLEGWDLPTDPALCMADFSRCRFPPAVSMFDDSASRRVDALNDQLKLQEALVDRQDEPLVTFSHFLPRIELLLEKRFLMIPCLAKASGSNFLRARVEQLKPDVHIFGHTHFGWDTVLDGVRYVQAALGYPHEREMRWLSMANGDFGAAPLLLWSSSSGFSKRSRCRWSAYYEHYGRKPEKVLELASYAARGVKKTKPEATECLPDFSFW
ncbi:Ankyrin repeat domain-containing protein 50 [Durusdinium trenchii]|uniref:Ankyrin repeat domain-containing protein 50 n=1 Tax=Durusdinium trenchii TaxID=1381693 RepID=A0ABP0IJB7_9DINO